MRLNKPPLTKEQSKQGDLIPPGIYPFEVVDAIDDISKSSGNDMITLKLKIFMPDGKERILFDYLLEAMEFKLAHFFDAIGKWDKYESGAFCADDCYGMSGEVKIYIQKDKKGEYPDKSAVADYMLSEAQEAAKTERKLTAVKQQAKDDFVDSDLDADLPF